MAQFDSLESRATLRTEVFQFQEYPLLQRLALSYEIAEGGADELAKHPMGQMATVIFEERASVWIERPFFFITCQNAKIYFKTFELR